MSMSWAALFTVRLFTSSPMFVKLKASCANGGFPASSMSLLDSLLAPELAIACVRTDNQFCNQTCSQISRMVASTWMRHDLTSRYSFKRLTLTCASNVQVHGIDPLCILLRVIESEDLSQVTKRIRPSLRNLRIHFNLLGFASLTRFKFRFGWETIHIQQITSLGELAIFPFNTSKDQAWQSRNCHAMENAIQCNQKNALTVGFHDWLSLHSHWCQLFAARNYRHWEIQATTQPSCVQGSLYAIVHLLVSLQQRSPVKSSNVQEGARLKWTISLDKTYNHANIDWNNRFFKWSSTSNTFSQCPWVISPRLEVFSMDIDLGVNLLVRLTVAAWIGLKAQRSLAIGSEL